MKVFGFIFLAAIVIIAFMANAWLAAFGLLAIGGIGLLAYGYGIHHEDQEEERERERIEGPRTRTVTVNNYGNFVDHFEIPWNAKGTVVYYRGLPYKVRVNPDYHNLFIEISKGPLGIWSRPISFKRNKANHLTH
jgi:hypothetical protein